MEAGQRGRRRRPGRRLKRPRLSTRRSGTWPKGLRLLSVLLHPFIPQTAAAIRERLGLAPAAGGRRRRWG